MTIIQHQKVSGKFLWNFLAILVALSSMLMSCSDEPGSVEQVEATEFDPSLAVEIHDFLPKTGAAGQRLILYGSNFGNDASKVKVKIGGKDAVVISARGESLYCLVPPKAFTGEIEVTVSDKGKEVYATAATPFEYERKMVVSTVIGYRNARGDEPWKDGKFSDPDQTKMASGFWEPSFMKFDPANPKHLWVTFDNNNGLYLINFEDSTVTKKRSDFDRPRSIDFTLDNQYMIIAEDRGGENDRATYRLSRDRDWQDMEILTRYRQCNGASVHPVNGELYFNSYEKGQFFRFDLNAYFRGELEGDKDYETLFVVHDPMWEYKITIHPSGNYAYINVINQHYILRVDYNWEKQRFNQPYLVCGQLSAPGYVDGVGSSVRLNQPYQGVFVKNPQYEAEGKSDIYDFYFTDKSNHAVRILTPEGSVTTFAGRGSASLNPDPYGYVDGDLREQARFDQPSGIAYNEEENAFYIGDQANRRIRKIALETEETASDVLPGEGTEEGTEEGQTETNQSN